MRFQIIQACPIAALHHHHARATCKGGIDDDYHKMHVHDHGPAYVMMTMTKLPHYSRHFTLIARSLLLAFVFALLPLLRTTAAASQFSSSSSSLATISQPQLASPLNFNLFSLVFRDLTREGLLKPAHKALIVCHCNCNDADSASPLFHMEDINVDFHVISSSHLEHHPSVPDRTFDLAFLSGFPFRNPPGFLDRVLKLGGIVVLQLNDDHPSFHFNKLSNYQMVYFRRFESSILAMRRTAAFSANSPMQRRLLGYHSPEQRKAALRKLEDVLLEPPRAASRKSRTYLKKTRYLPDLTGDSLESYPRRVFIDVGLPEREGGSGTGWFKANYPTRNLEFDMYKIETMTEDSSGKQVLPGEEVAGGMSEWLRKNVKEEEYVVMKAEAEVVEEVVRGMAIGLVDELFLECKPKGHAGNYALKRRSRAYWECLALYGKLRDEGVAVHQWWG